jgi:hypothetical protein
VKERKNARRYTLAVIYSGRTPDARFSYDNARCCGALAMSTARARLSDLSKTQIVRLLRSGYIPVIYLRPKKRRASMPSPDIGEKP